jgi:hypothetical protein
MYFFGRRVEKSESNGIEIALVPNDEPQFRRGYTARIDGGFRVEMELRTSSGRRYDSSSLYQANGKYILFDANAVADKIIDRDLYPKVQAVVDRILELDADFLASKPTRFTDENGVVWQRVK